MKELVTSICFDTETPDGYPLHFRYNGSLTVNVFTGLRESVNDFLQDPVEIDVFTLNKPGLVTARLAIDEYLENYGTAHK